MFTLNCKGKLLLIDQPIVMGIINATPDSFYSNSRQQALDEVVAMAGKMLAAGAGMLDLGGQSTRPGSEHINASEEAERVVPAIAAIAADYPEAIISVDTYYASVAKAAVEAGASIVNDISGGLLDTDMLATVAQLRVPYICMHMRGNPQTMQQYTQYSHLTQDVLDYFIERINACTKAGINDVIVDPGFGFSKTIRQNFELLNQLDKLAILQKPLLLGVSRKGTIYKTLGITAEEALNGTTVLNTIGLMKGAHILRVHDVREAVEAVRLYKEVAG